MSNAVGAIIVNLKNEVLLQKRTFDYKKGVWNIFGGAKEKNESSNCALFRELEEELELYFEVPKKFPRPHKVKNKKEITDLFYIRADIKTSDITLREGAGFAFFNKKELKQLNLAKDSRKILESYYG